MAAAHPHRLGFAKVPLSGLRFVDRLEHENGQQHMLPQIDERNVVRLADIFRLAGPLREERQNFIRAVADTSSVRDRLSQDPPEVDDVTVDDLRVRCLRGRNRAEAARRTLAAEDQWWIVEVFDEGTPFDVQWRLATDRSSDRGPHDGFVYAQLQIATDNKQTSDGWLARLTVAGRRDYKQLCNASNKELKAALDGLLPFPGLWQPFSFGIVQRLTKLRCGNVSIVVVVSYLLLAVDKSQELSQYLTNVRRIWSTILLGSSELFALLDAHTVSLLELRVPARASDDATHVTRLMGKGQLFPCIVDPRTRLSIEAVLLGARVRIPSLRTFLEDTKYVTHGANILKRLLPSRLKGVTQTQSAFRDMYSGQLFSTHYRRLWLHALAKFNELLPVTTKKDPSSVRPSPGRADLRPWKLLACEAVALGFKSPQITEFQKEDVEQVAALELLQRFYPDLDRSASLTSISGIAEILRRPPQRRTRVQRPPELGSDYIPLSTNRRCGVPHATSFDADRRYIVDSTFGDMADSMTLYTWPSTFAMMRDLFRCFFAQDDVGTPADGLTLQTRGVGQDFAFLRSSSLYSEIEQTTDVLPAPQQDFPLLIDNVTHEEDGASPDEDLSPTSIGSQGPDEVLIRKRKRGHSGDAQSYGFAIDQLIAHLQDPTKVYFWCTEDQTLYVSAEILTGWRDYTIWVLGPQGAWFHPNPRCVLDHVLACGHFAVAVPRRITSPPHVWNDLLQFIQIKDRLGPEYPDHVLYNRLKTALSKVSVVVRAIRSTNSLLRIEYLYK